MLSAYPAISEMEFYEAGTALQHAYATSHQTSDWIDFKCTRTEIFIQQRRNLSNGTGILEPPVMEDEECEIVEEFEQEDEVTFMFLQTIHFSHANF